MAGLVGGDGKLIAIIGDEDTVTGFVLAGVGHRTAESSNFLVVKEGTPLPQIEKAFLEFTNRDDVGIVLVNQHVAAQIRHLLDDYSKTIPTVLEMPSKDAPYDPAQDYIMQRVSAMLNTGHLACVGGCACVCASARRSSSPGACSGTGDLTLGHTTAQSKARRGWPPRRLCGGGAGGSRASRSLTTVAAELPHFAFLA